MRIGVNPLVDCVFKKLFGSEENKNLLLSLINSIISINQSPAVQLEILNPYNLQSAFDDKMSIIDIKAQNEMGEIFLIEVQVMMLYFFPKRLLYYWARQYSSQLTEGEKYDKLHRVSVISITPENLPLPIPAARYLSCFRILEYQSHIPYLDDLNIYTIELAKFNLTYRQLESEALRWFYFLKHAESLDSDNLPVSLHSDVIQQAVKECQMWTKDQQQREIYESKIKAQRDFISITEAKYDQGFQNGQQKGQQDGTQKSLHNVAIRALQAGLDVAMIQTLTGLSQEEILRIKDTIH